MQWKEKWFYTQVTHKWKVLLKSFFEVVVCNPKEKENPSSSSSPEKSISKVRESIFRVSLCHLFTCFLFVCESCIIHVIRNIIIVIRARVLQHVKLYSRCFINVDGQQHSRQQKFAEAEESQEAQEERTTVCADWRLTTSECHCREAEAGSRSWNMRVPKGLTAPQVSRYRKPWHDIRRRDEHTFMSWETLLVMHHHDSRLYKNRKQKHPSLQVWV